MTRDMITSHAGLALLGEFAIELGLLQSVDRYLPKPGRGAGYNPSEYTVPLILMLNGGGRHPPDKRDCERSYLSRGSPHRMPLGSGFGAWVSMLVSMALKK